MNTTAKLFAFGSLILLAGCASAKAEAEPPKMQCSMMADKAAMQKDMASIVTEMDAITKGVSDPVLRERLEKVHARMAMMSSKMQKKGGMGMMDGMMGGSKTHRDEAPPEVPLAAPPSDEHKDHHPPQ